jgi:hypothetical protein
VAIFSDVRNVLEGWNFRVHQPQLDPLQSLLLEPEMVLHVTVVRAEKIETAQRW